TGAVLPHSASGENAPRVNCDFRANPPAYRKACHHGASAIALVVGRAFARPVGSSGLHSLWLRNGQVSFHSCTLRMLSLSRREASRHVVWQPAHTFGLKRVVARERAALFTDLPQMRVEH